MFPKREIDLYSLDSMWGDDMMTVTQELPEKNESLN